MIRKIILLTLLVTSFPFGLRSEILGTAEFSEANNNFSYEHSWPRMILMIKHAIYDPDWGPIETSRIAFWTWLDSTDVDTVLIATSETTGFSHTVTHLTNDIAEYFGVSFYLPSRSSGYGGATDYHLEQEAFSLGGIDFCGADISSISLKLEELSFDIVDGSYGPLIDFYCRVTMTIEGTWVATETSSWGAIKCMYAK